MQNLKKAFGRFAPTPSGRMHLGNIVSALVAWLSVRAQNGTFLLRIEDLDRARCKNPLWIDYIKEDLIWLGLYYDNNCEADSYQSNRDRYYNDAFEHLNTLGLLYPCFCSRDELHAASAPHALDGQVLYARSCRRYLDRTLPRPQKQPAFRISVPNETISFSDGIQGDYHQNLLHECSDFILRRSDSIFSYQLAVVVDDALSGVTEVVRGCDLLSSTPRQIWLYRLLGYPVPQFYHVPLLCAWDGTRLSKRDEAIDLGALRTKYTSAEPLLGMLAYALHLLPSPEPIRAEELIPLFSFDKIPAQRAIFLPKFLWES